MDNTNAMLYHILFHKENKERYKISPGIDGKKLKYDALGRVHLDTLYSGYCHLRIRSHKYNSTTVATHITDLYNILAHYKKTKSVYTGFLYIHIFKNYKKMSLKNPKTLRKC